MRSLTRRVFQRMVFLFNFGDFGSHLNRILDPFPKAHSPFVRQYGMALSRVTARCVVVFYFTGNVPVKTIVWACFKISETCIRWIWL